MGWRACAKHWATRFSSGRATAWSRHHVPRRSPGLFSNCWNCVATWLKAGRHSHLTVSSANSSLPDRTSPILRSEEHTSELQSLMRISYDVFCLKKKTPQQYKAHKPKPQN